MLRLSLRRIFPVLTILVLSSLSVQASWLRDSPDQLDLCSEEKLYIKIPIFSGPQGLINVQKDYDALMQKLDPKGEVVNKGIELFMNFKQAFDDLQEAERLLKKQQSRLLMVIRSENANGQPPDDQIHLEPFIYLHKAVSQKKERLETSKTQLAKFLGIPY